MSAGAAINKFLARLGAKPSDAVLSAKWDEIVGQNSELVKISRGVANRTAYIRPKNPGEKLILSYEIPVILKKINDYFGYNAIGKIVIK